MTTLLPNSSKTMTVEKCRLVRDWLKNNKPKEHDINAHCNICEVWTPADMSVYFFGMCENCAEIEYERRTP